MRIEGNLRTPAGYVVMITLAVEIGILMVVVSKTKNCNCRIKNNKINKNNVLYSKSRVKSQRYKPYILPAGKV